MQRGRFSQRNFYRYGSQVSPNVLELVRRYQKDNYFPVDGSQLATPNGS